MKRKTSRVVLLAALLFAAGVARGQDTSAAGPKRARTPDDYEPRTLKEVAAAGQGARRSADKAETMIVLGDILPSRVRATYAGAARRLPPTKKEIIRRWARLYAGSPESYTRPYETELLFVAGGTKYWLAVRRAALPSFGTELKRGEEVDLYLIRLGAAKERGAWEPVLLIESFREPD